jgi:hypothetical protein
MGILKGVVTVTYCTAVAVTTVYVILHSGLAYSQETIVYRCGHNLYQQKPCADKSIQRTLDVSVGPRDLNAEYMGRLAVAMHSDPVDDYSGPNVVTFLYTPEMYRAPYRSPYANPYTSSYLGYGRHQEFNHRGYGRGWRSDNYHHNYGR